MAIVGVALSSRRRVSSPNLPCRICLDGLTAKARLEAPNETFAPRQLLGLATRPILPQVFCAVGASCHQAREFLEE